MRRILKALISLYPASWRHRYSREYEALLDDVPPTCKALFDVLGGALQMQLAAWTTWKIIPAFALLGLIVAAAFSLTIPDRYVSQAVLKPGDGGVQEVRAAATIVFARSPLTRLINEEDLYRSERARMPLEDLIELMKTRDIKFRADGQETIIGFTAANPESAQRVTRLLAASFVNAKTASLVDAASLPTQPVSPRRSRIIIMGFLAGLLAGVLFALFHGLHVWKLASACGVAGLAVGLMIAFVMPQRYSSRVVLRYESADRSNGGARIRELIHGSQAEYLKISRRFALQSGELAQHLRFLSIDTGHALMIEFDGSDPFTAQKVAQDTASVLMELNIRRRVEMKFRNLPMPSDLTVELLDPASLPITPFTPNRPMVAGAGLFAGFGMAIALGVRRLKHVGKAAF